MRRPFCVLIVGLLALSTSWRHQDGARSCSTFLLRHEATLLVGHNLDESMAVPGLVVVNARGVAKRNISFDELKSSAAGSSAPRLEWVSKYGSVTYNTFGREFPDGGMNEAGLYVGEMTLLATAWPEARSLPRMYHHQWIQYLLDTSATVEDALATLSKALPHGHCRWHFFLADRGGDAAVVEFLGKPAVYHRGTLPYPILANDEYRRELDDLRNYEGFGGRRPPQPRYEREDPRFRWAAVMLQRYDSSTAPVDYAFAILERLNTGNTKWSLVCDLAGGRIYFRTSTAPRVRFLDMRALDFGCADAPPAVDIHLDFEGDVRAKLAPLSDERNRAAIGKAWAEIDAGLVGNRIFKPAMVRGLARASSSLRCPPRNELAETRENSGAMKLASSGRRRETRGGQSGRGARVAGVSQVAGGSPSRAHGILRDRAGSWFIVGAADLDDNGWPDFVLRNFVTGENTAWSTLVAERQSVMTLPTETDSRWEIQALGDLNSDGVTDLVWRKAESGLNRIWLMRRGMLVTSSALPTVTVETWQIVGPR